MGSSRSGTGLALKTFARKARAICAEHFKLGRVRGRNRLPVTWFHRSAKASPRRLGQTFRDLIEEYRLVGQGANRLSVTERLPRFIEAVYN